MNIGFKLTFFQNDIDTCTIFISKYQENGFKGNIDKNCSTSALFGAAKTGMGIIASFFHRKMKELLYIYKLSMI